ncbi:MAG: PAS domain S-box protein [Victivallaceae bacterium]
MRFYYCMSRAVSNCKSHIRLVWDIACCSHWLWLACFMLLNFVCLPPACSAASKLDKVILQLKWKHQFQFAGYYAAVENGYYKDAGLDVTIVEAQPGLDPAEAVLSGKADFGIAGSSLALLREKGRPVVVLAAIFQHSPLVIMMKDDGAIADVRSLIGRKVMIEPLSAEVMTYLQIENVNPDSLTMLPHSFDIKDLIENKVDAMTVYTTTEPYHLRKLKIPYKLFQPYTCGIDFYGDCLFTTENEIKLHPERVKAFREASLRGWKYAMDHPEDLITIIRQKYNRRLSREQLQFEAIEMRALINPNVIEIGYMNRSRWQHIVDTYKKAGQISADIPLKDFIYTTAPFSFHQRPYYVAITLLALLAACIGFVAMRFRKFNVILKNEIELRDHAEKELKETRNILEAAFDQSPAGIIIADAPDGRLRHFNKAARQILGSSEDEVAIGMNSKQFTPGEQLLYQDGTKVKPEEGPLARAILHGESSSKEFISRQTNHDQHTVWVKAAPVLDDRGIIKAGIAVVLDITERRKAHLALQESEKRFKTMADNAPILLWMSGPDGLCTYFNRRWLEFTGRTLGQESGNGWIEGVHPEDHQHCLYTRTKAFNTRQSFVMEYRIRYNNGEYRWIMDSGVPRFNADGDFLGYIGTGTDITDRKIAEEELRESEIRFRQIAENACDMVWEVDSSGMYTYCSSVVKHILGYSASELIGHKHFYDLFAPEVRDELKTVVRAAFERMEPFRHFVNPCIHKNGKTVFMETSGVPVLNESGILIGYRGTDTDITDRKIAEKELREREQFLRQAEHISRVGGWKVNPETNSLFWTEGLRAILELPAEYQPALEEWLKFFAPEYVPLVKDTICKSMKQGTDFVVEAEAITATGKRFWAEIRGTAQTDSTGGQQIMGTFQDITDHKLTEDFIKGGL